MSDGGRRAKTKALKVALGDIKAAYNEGRAAGLEEAAQIVDPIRNGLVRQYILCVDAAAAIRALKEKP